MSQSAIDSAESEIKILRNEDFCVEEKAFDNYNWN